MSPTAPMRPTSHGTAPMYRRVSDSRRRPADAPAGGGPRRSLLRRAPSRMEERRGPPPRRGPLSDGEKGGETEGSRPPLLACSPSRGHSQSPTRRMARKDSDGLGWTRMDSDGLGWTRHGGGGAEHVGSVRLPRGCAAGDGAERRWRNWRMSPSRWRGRRGTDIAGRPAVGDEAAQHRREQDGRLAAPLAAAIAPLLLLSQADRSGGPDLRQLSRSSIPLSISMPATSPDSSPLAL